MKLRITKGRIACAVAIIPVLFLLNIGPLIYCSRHFGLDRRIIQLLYAPPIAFLDETPLGEPYDRYIVWWMEVSTGHYQDR